MFIPGLPSEGRYKAHYNEVLPIGRRHIQISSGLGDPHPSLA